MATVQVEITNTNDDAVDAPGFGLDPTALLIGFFFSTAFSGGFRHQAVGIPQGSTINTATLTLNVTGVTGTPNTTVYGADVDDVAVWADPGNLPSAASRTTASVSGPTATGSQALNVASIVQEIVDRGGWVSGNDMGFVIINNSGSGDNYFQAEDYEAAGTAEAVLDVDYTAPANKRRYTLTTLGVG